MLILKLFSNSKLVLHFHGMFKPFSENFPFTVQGKNKKLNKLLINILFLPADRVIFLSENILNEFTGILRTRNKRKSLFINHFVDTFNYPGRNRKDQNADLGIIFLGRLSKAKGFFDALEALCILKERNFRFHFHICGATEDDDSVFSNKNYIQLLNMKCITYHGLVQGEEKFRRIADSDIFLFPSHNEVFPNAILEGLAAGLPIVSTNVGVIPEILTNDENALLCNPEDIEQLTLNIANLLSSEELRRKMSKNNRILSREKFDIQLAVDKLSTVFNS